MKKIDFKDRIQSNPRLLRLRNPSTGEIIDYEIQDLLENEIVQDGTEVSSNVLNEMQDNMEEVGVVVSPTEPTTNEKVWIQKGKNLFNKNNAIKGFWVDSSNGNVVSAEDYNMVSEIISVLPNTKYTLSGISGVASNGTAWVTILSYSKEKTFNTMIFDNATLGTTFTTGENDYYIRVAIGNISLTTVQLEQGSTATEYEPYIEKKIYCKNDNGEFEEFVNVENEPTLENINQLINITPLKGSNYNGYGNSYYYKKGSTVYVHLGLSNLTVNTLEVVYTLPVGHRPNQPISFLGVGENLTQIVCGQIIPNGEIKIQSPSSYALLDFCFKAFK